MSPFNRLLAKRSNILAGLLIGTVSFVVAVNLVPQSVKSCGEHDQILAIWLGLIYAPLTLLWFRTSNSRIPFGLFGTFIAGLVAGAFYALLCAVGLNFIFIMVVFPGLFACLLNVLKELSREEKPGSANILKASKDGLFAGLVAGAVYATVLNLGYIALYLNGLIDGMRTVEMYANDMKTYGPATFALASAVFFHLIGKSKSSN